MREINLYWTYPRDYSRICEHPYSDCIGLYYVSRVWGGKETVLYVGETLQCFEKRIKQHNYKQSGYTLKRGKLRVRFGTIPASFNMGNMNKHHFLLTLESAVIHNIIDKPKVDFVNRRQIQSYTYYYDLHIHNTGFRGEIDKIIETER